MLNICRTHGRMHAGSQLPPEHRRRDARRTTPARAHAINQSVAHRNLLHFKRSIHRSIDSVLGSRATHTLSPASLTAACVVAPAASSAPSPAPRHPIATAKRSRTLAFARRAAHCTAAAISGTAASAATAVCWRTQASARKRSASQKGMNVRSVVASRSGERGKCDRASEVRASAERRSCL